MKIIDIHCHIGNGIYKKQSTTQLIQNMNENEIDISIIVPVEEEIAVCNQKGNDFILNEIDKYPDRLKGMAVANPWYGEESVRILENALKSGMCGIKFNPAIQGFKINDVIAYPLIELAEKYNVPIYFHTGTPVTCIPFQVADLATLYPNVNFIMGHSGYSDFWNDVPFIMSNYKNVYCDTSISLTSRHEDILAVGAGDRLLFGSDSPHSNLAYELKKVKMINADESNIEKVLYNNASKLFKF